MFHRPLYPPQCFSSSILQRIQKFHTETMSLTLHVLTVIQTTARIETFFTNKYLLSSFVLYYRFWFLTLTFLFILLLHFLFLCFSCNPRVIGRNYKRVLNVFYSATGGRTWTLVWGFYPLKPRGVWGLIYCWIILASCRTWRWSWELIQRLQLFKLCKSNQHPDGGNHRYSNLNHITLVSIVVTVKLQRKCSKIVVECSKLLTSLQTRDQIHKTPKANLVLSNELLRYRSLGGRNTISLAFAHMHTQILFFLLSSLIFDVYIT